MNAYEENNYFKGKASGYKLGYGLLNNPRRWNPIVKEITKLKKNGSILDIGCAYGYLLKFTPNAFQKYGIDMSNEAVLAARKENPAANISKGDFLETDFNGQSFDIITCMETLEHIQDLDNSLRKMHSLLNEGGYLLVSFPVVNSFLEKRWFTMFDKTHINVSDKIISKIRKRFKIIKIKYTFDCFKLIIISKHRVFPVHQSYFIIAQKVI